MRVLSWNINGIRRILGNYKSCEEFVRGLEADIVCFQETKAFKSALGASQVSFDTFQSYWSFCHSNRSYSGVCVYSKETPLAVEEGLSGGYTTFSVSIPQLSDEDKLKPLANIHSYNQETLLGQNYHPDFTNVKQLDTEGRALCLDYGMFVLINVYCPAEGDESRVKFKKSFHELLFERIRILKEGGRQIILLGDINIAHRAIDHCDGLELTRTDIGKMEFETKYTRQWMDKLVSDDNSPLVDIMRLFHPTREGMFTCWNQLINARPSNYGTRIDYVLITPGLIPWVKEADIAPSVYNSDHCPVFIDLHDSIPDPHDDTKVLHLKDYMSKPKGAALPPLCASNWDEFNGKQTSLSSFFQPGIKKISPSRSLSRSTTPKNHRDQPQIESFFQPRGRTNSGDHNNPANPSKKQKVDNDKTIKSAWKALMAPKRVPKCKVHNEDCREYTVNKPGPNKGKKFWLCSRNVGPGYDAGGSKRNRADVDSRYRCNFFVWSSHLERDMSGIEDYKSDKQ
ncbi:DNase I-like protein [Wallemia mellicola]|uniref:DNA-(apurinic or apyrimidinic site) endonuclease n=1 Tax=Wallemia mellicola TaxID=1708541 RepID=A0A4T0LWQ2_9BASI|nr:DNase I-like protein [Wallemia mellicola]TIC12259.1 DNase I-like protein [Wallemia mellicola]